MAREVNGRLESVDSALVVATEEQAPAGQTKPRATVPRKRSPYQSSAYWFRWVHIYVSMLSFAALFFFAVTGITLNHPSWLGAGEQTLRDDQGNAARRAGQWRGS